MAWPNSGDWNGAFIGEGLNTVGPYLKDILEALCKGVNEREFYVFEDANDRTAFTVFGGTKINPNASDFEGLYVESALTVANELQTAITNLLTQRELQIALYRFFTTVFVRDSDDYSLFTHITDFLARLPNANTYGLAWIDTTKVNHTNLNLWLQLKEAVTLLRYMKAYFVPQGCITYHQKDWFSVGVLWEDIWDGIRITAIEHVYDKEPPDPLVLTLPKWYQIQNGSDGARITRKIEYTSNNFSYVGMTNPWPGISVVRSLWGILGTYTATGNQTSLNTEVTCAIDLNGTPHTVTMTTGTPPTTVVSMLEIDDGSWPTLDPDDTPGDIEITTAPPVDSPFDISGAGDALGSIVFEYNTHSDLLFDGSGTDSNSCQVLFDISGALTYG